MTATRPTVPDITRAALAFIEAHGLDVPRLEVDTNHPGTQGWDPSARHSGDAPMVTLPPGNARVHFIRSLPAFLAWCHALDVTRVNVDRDRPESTHLAFSAWRDGIRWGVVALIPHGYGTPHLPGTGVTWHDRRRGVVTVDGLAAATHLAEARS